MRIGIIGSGKIGGTAGTLWGQRGHAIMFSSRHPEALKDVVAAAGPEAQAGTAEQAAAFGDVVLVAIPFGLYETLPQAELAGKIVIDATNYYPGRDGAIDLGGRASSELIAAQLPESQVVKAFNTMYYETLRTAGRPDASDDRLVLFIAGDDAAAKATVAGLIEEIGFVAVDTGTLAAGGKLQEPDSPIYNKPMNAAQARATLATE
jgi:predicted dinucleotide-binding enzyme